MCLYKQGLEQTLNWMLTRPVSRDYAKGKYQLLCVHSSNDKSYQTWLKVHYLTT